MSLVWCRTDARLVSIGGTGNLGARRVLVIGELGARWVLLTRELGARLVLMRDGEMEVRDARHLERERMSWWRRYALIRTKGRREEGKGRRK